MRCKPLSLVLLLAPLLAACGSPPTHFHLLTSLSTGKMAVTDRKLTVALETVEVSRYLNRPQVVSRSGQNRLQLAASNHWASSLKEEITRILADNLATLLDSDRIYTLPARDMEHPDFRVALEVSRFEPDPEGKVILKANWRLFAADHSQEVIMHRSVLVSPAVNKNNYDEIAATMSTLLGNISQEIAQAILAEPLGRTKRGQTDFSYP